MHARSVLEVSFYCKYPKTPHTALNLYRKGVLPGSVERPKVSKLSVSDISKPVRPYFKSICRFDDVYVTLLRLVMFSSVRGFGADDLTLTYHFHAGKHLGYELIKKGIVKTLDDLFPVLAKYRIGLVDVVKESANTMVLDVYECVIM